MKVVQANTALGAVSQHVIVVRRIGGRVDEIATRGTIFAGSRIGDVGEFASLADLARDFIGVVLTLILAGAAWSATGDRVRGVVRGASGGDYCACITCGAPEV